jgi:hypothetical protein
MSNLIFPEKFIIALEALINIHHSIYKELPPQGIYFEALVEEAFRRIKKPFTLIEPGVRNQPRHDLLVENARISLKTETGVGTRAQKISITKLCTTEREPWEASVLLERTAEHLDRYDYILMLRAVWQLPLIHYQLVEIPVTLLKLMANSTFASVGKRTGRQSIGADVVREGEILFHVHFDGSDGKCQIRNLDLKNCSTLSEWDLKI